MRFREIRDYNQNARDWTVASAWSVRPTPDARVSMPLEWDEVADCDPTAFTLATAPARFAGHPVDWVASDEERLS
jgi:DNA primase